MLLVCGCVDVSLYAVTVVLVVGDVDVSLCAVSGWLCGCEFVCC